MLVRDLIKTLEDLIERHKVVEEMMGPAEIHIDTFGLDGDTIRYRGVSPDIRVTPSGDGVYQILTAWEPDTP